MNEISGQTSSPTFDEVAERFVEELRAGKLPSLAEYKKAWPHLAEEIDELFPMLQELEVHQESSSTPDKTLDVSGIPDKLGEYEIVREIGRGGMGVVYEARHDVMQRRVALKVLPRSFGERKHFLERFMREARSAGKLHHTNIVPVFEVGDADGTYFYAMQYIHGQNLDVVIDELRRISRSDQRQSSLSAATDQASVAMTLWRGSTKMAEANDTGVNSNTIEVGVEEDRGTGWAQLPSEKQVGESSEWSQVGDSGDSYFRRAARVGIQCAEALDFAHAHGLLHRDIKPSNLILDTNGVVWITDFGLAKVDGDNLTHTGDIVGTLRYMAPERFQGKADRRSDIYSLGLTLYELCTLEYAFDADDRAALIHQVMNHAPVALRRIRPEIPRDLETVIVKAMAREPQSRYETAGQMAADLRRYVAGKPVLARRASIPERVWRWSKRHPSRAALALSLMLLAATIVIGSLYFGYRERQHSNELGAENIRVRKAEKEARAAETEAREALKTVETARLGSRSHLFWSNYQLGSALRTTGTPGHRSESIKALQAAYRVLPELGLSEKARKRRELAVRAHAFSALGNWELSTGKTYPSRQGWTASIATDFVRNRYSRVSETGKIEVCDSETSEVIKTFQATNEQRAWL
ncbi:MAG: serine/threonine-protein kinase, partial [Pirellulaceae bacterium]